MDVRWASVSDFGSLSVPRLVWNGGECVYDGLFVFMMQLSSRVSCCYSSPGACQCLCSSSHSWCRFLVMWGRTESWLVGVLKTENQILSARREREGEIERERERERRLSLQGEIKCVNGCGLERGGTLHQSRQSWRRAIIILGIACALLHPLGNE